MKKIAIVTGASSGIGKLLATGLPAHAQFDELWAIARSEARLNALKEEMPIPVRPIPLDLTKAEKEEEGKEKSAKYLRRECRVSCQRSYYIGDTEEDTIKAKYDKGVLTVTLPKKEEKKPEAKRNITIE